MTFRDWRELSPAAAAREVHQRVDSRLNAQQRRAVMATLPSENDLAPAFAAAPRAGPFGGVPYFVKDLFDVAGLPTFAGSSFLPEVRPTPPRSSSLIRALSDQGAVLAGKTHTHEFAYGITGENPHFGDVQHPRFPTRT